MKKIPRVHMREKGEIMSQPVSRAADKKEQNSMVKDLTKGSVPVLLLAFAAPLFVSNALQAIYNIVDMIVVGQVIGKTGMSAVAVGGNVLQIMNFIAMGFSSAGQILIARSVGQKNYRYFIQRTVSYLTGHFSCQFLFQTSSVKLDQYACRSF